MTVEPGFKSRQTPTIDSNTLTIGETARLLGVATSTLRYYERRGLVAADSRVSGQRRYNSATVRRLVFVQMLQDAGLSLDDIEGILDADNNATWKEIARSRLTQLDDQITRLQHSRGILAAALLCRFDHPLDECHIMNSEIDQRLATAEQPPNDH